MDEATIQDIVASQSILNLLSSGYQGSYAAINILLQLDHYLASKEILLQHDRTLSRIGQWTDELLKGTPLISKKWKAIETFEAQTAFDDLARLRKELVQLTDELKTIRAKGPLGPVIEDIRFYFANYARYIYGRDFFVRGQIEYAKTFRIREIFESSSQFAAQIANSIPEVDSMFEEVKAGTPPKAFLQVLAQRTRELPTTFAVQAHEMSMILATYEPALTYDMTEIGKYEAERWMAANVAPAAAGYWRAFDMGPEEASAWIDVQIERPAMAYSWRSNGFSPGDVQQWIEYRIPPEPAALWRDAGFTAQETLQHVKKGLTDPKEVKRQKKRRQ